jgi:hypothetical protein
MRLLAITSFLLIAASIGFGQMERATVAAPDPIKLLAKSEVKEGGTLKVRGHVQVITSSTTVYADEADYNPLTGQLNARGHVHIDFRNAKPSITIQNSTPEDIQAR